jgi:hypothetical protein
MKMTPDTERAIAAATVWFPRLRGQGVVVPGNLIVTAAHVVPKNVWLHSGRQPPPREKVRAWRHFHAESRIPSDSVEFTVNIVAVEPIADIAVLEHDPTIATPPRWGDLSIKSIEPVRIFTGHVPRGGSRCTSSTPIRGGFRGRRLEAAPLRSGSGPTP